MSILIDFFNHPFFILVGGISTIVGIAALCYTLYLIIKGVLPVWYRLGLGLSKRRIAIFATTEYDSLRGMLVDSNIFVQKNIEQIGKNEIKKAESFTIFLVHWKDYQDNIDEIMQIKKDGAALIVYAPQNEGRIEPLETMEKINAQRNTVVVNFRGRLLNDILISLITTAYER